MAIDQHYWVATGSFYVKPLRGEMVARGQEGLGRVWGRGEVTDHASVDGVGEVALEDAAGLRPTGACSRAPARRDGGLWDPASGQSTGTLEGPQ
jgi:hypothetical protein